MLVVISESDITKTRNPAAAELDHFLLSKKVGTRTVLAEIPVFLVFVKHVLMDSDTTTSTPVPDRQLRASFYWPIKAKKLLNFTVMVL